MGEIPEKDRCRTCRGRGKMRRWTDTPDGVCHQPILCPSCGGTGIDLWVQIRELPFPGDFERFRKALLKCAFPTRPPRQPNHACELRSVVVPPCPAGAHDHCRVEDYDQAAEDKAFLAGIAAKPKDPPVPDEPGVSGSGTEGLSVEQTAEWYIRRWEKRTGRPWPQTGRRRIDLPGNDL